ncbi:glycosyltransferase [Lentisphaera marina]|uniref:glycosyltransferase n=1 Tax=Lentisphaera marina TaxID=1111041 RepID=UPI0023672AE8|nr:glycosyltransferase [Lentisphaera marina]MDD7986904.1 glycosyltransferase [Lentisphaera marina]
MKIAQLTPSLSNAGGGVSKVVIELASNLKNNTDVFIHLFSSDKPCLNEVHIQHHFSKPHGPKSFSFSNELTSQLLNFSPDLIHLHGIWMYHQLASFLWQKKTNKAVIISPHGMLDSWAIQNSKWKKWLISKLFANRSLQAANCIHALCEAEYLAIRNYGITAPVCIIPNAVDLPKASSYQQAPWNQNNKKTCLYLGRIHPKKGLINLINAWDKKLLENWQLIIAGWSENDHEQEIKDLIKSRSLQTEIILIGAVFDKDKQAAYQNADAFILPSYSEGLPMTILEAWSYKLPVLMTEACNLPEGFENNCAIKIAPSTSSIEKGLNELASMSPQELNSMGEKSFKLVKERFTWTSVSSTFHSVYKWCINGKNIPDCVRLN